MNVTGYKISTTAREYDSWTDDKGEKRPGGTTLALWIAPSEQSDPMKLKVKDEGLFAEIEQLPFGSPLTVTVDVTSRGQIRGVLAVDLVAA